MPSQRKRNAVAIFASLIVKLWCLRLVRGFTPVFLALLLRNKTYTVGPLSSCNLRFGYSAVVVWLLFFVGLP